MSVGRLYKECINAGALSVTSAHIALPSYAQQAGEVGFNGGDRIGCPRDGRDHLFCAIPAKQG